MTLVSAVTDSIKYRIKLSTTNTDRDAEIIDFLNSILRNSVTPALLRHRSDIGRTEWISTETTANVRRYALPTNFIAFDELYCIEIEHSGTIATGGTATVILDSDASDDDDFYNAMLIRTTGGTGADQQTVIVDYTGSTLTAELEPDLTTAADGTTTFAIFEYPTESERMKLKSIHTVNREYSSTGTPQMYALDGSYLVLGSIPTEAMILWGYYYSLPTLLTATTDTLPYNDLFNEILVQYGTIMALNVDEYNLQNEQAIYMKAESDVETVLSRRGERSTNLLLRGTEDDSGYV